MTISAIILLVSLVGISSAAAAMVFAVLRARNKRLLLSVVHGTSCDGMRCIGISVLGSDVCDPAQVENLMTVEYARYEVVLVIDARLRPAEFNALLNRYKMINVDYSPSEDLPSEGVRGLYRSRKRSYRRLVIIDRQQQDAVGDFDAAAAVASYDYLLPVSPGQYLLPEAVERLVVEVEERPGGTIDQVWGCVGESAVLLNRDAVIRARGFGSIPCRGFFRRRAKWLWEPIFRMNATCCTLARPARIALGTLLAAGTGIAFWTGYVPLLAVLLTAAFVWCCAEYAGQSLEDGGKGPVRLFPCRRPTRCKKLL